MISAPLVRNSAASLEQCAREMSQPAMCIDLPKPRARVEKINFAKPIDGNPRPGVRRG
jgi:hypothetical protein